MKFGAVAVAGAAGCILAHSLIVVGRKFQKGLKLSAEDIDALQAAGVETVTVAEVEHDDLAEDDAAAALAQRLLAPA